MIYHGNAKQGDVIRTYGTGNAPGAGGLISTVIITDKTATGQFNDHYECRDATPSEVKAAEQTGRVKTHYC